jgi:hypothetical protein
MTKFEELMDITSRKKNTDRQNSDDRLKEDIQVAGSEGSKTPILECGDDDMDPGLLDQLHRSAKTKPNDGSGSSSWDSDY